MAEVLRFQFRYSDQLIFQNRPKLNELLSRPPSSIEENIDPVVYGSARKVAVELERHLSDGGKLLICATEKIPPSQTLDAHLKAHGISAADNTTLLLVSRQEALCSNNDAKETWHYGHNRVSIVWGTNQKVETVSGSVLVLGNRTWAKTGDPLSRLEQAEQPLERLRPESGVMTPRLNKLWGNRRLVIHESAGKIESFELHPR